MPGGNFGTGYSGGYGGGAMKGAGYGQRAAGPYGGRIVLAYAVFVFWYNSAAVNYFSHGTSLLWYLQGGPEKSTPDYYCCNFVHCQLSYFFHNFWHTAHHTKLATGG